MKKTSSVSFKNDLTEKTIEIVTFGARWCKFCALIKDELVELENKNQDVGILYIDADEEESLAEEFNITKLPTLLYFVKSELKKTEIGFKKCKDIENTIASLKKFI